MHKTCGAIVTRAGSPCDSIHNWDCLIRPDSSSLYTCPVRDDGWAGLCSHTIVSAQVLLWCRSCGQSRLAFRSPRLWSGLFPFTKIVCLCHRHVLFCLENLLLRLCDVCRLVTLTRSVHPDEQTNNPSPSVISLSNRLFLIIRQLFSFSSPTTKINSVPPHTFYQNPLDP